MVRGRAGQPAIAWFCSKCTTRNELAAERCANIKCQLSRKVIGVDILESDEPAARDVEHEPIVGIGEKRRRCGECSGCRAEECGVCAHCRDMPKRGGKGLKRQPCMKRICDFVKEGGAEREALRIANLERDRERREIARAERERDAERNRERRLEAKLAVRQARLAELEQTRQRREQAKLERAQTKLERAQARSARAASGALRRSAHTARVGARAPAHPTDLASYGWGAQCSYPIGCSVEVLGVDEGLCGACFAGSIVAPTKDDMRVLPKTQPTPPPNHIFFPPKGDGTDGSGPADGTGGSNSGSSGGSGGGSSSSSGSAPPAGWLCVEYLYLNENEDDDSPLLREWVASSMVRLAPPRQPAGMLSCVRPGDKMQLLLDDCYWDVTLEEIEASPEAAERPFVVASVLYAASHHASASELRPLWIWGGFSAPPADPTARPRWKYMLYGGSGLSTGDAPEENIFLAHEFMPRRHSVYYHTHGQRERVARSGQPELEASGNYAAYDHGDGGSDGEVEVQTEGGSDDDAEEEEEEFVNDQQLLAEHVRAEEELRQQQEEATPAGGGTSTSTT